MEKLLLHTCCAPCGIAVIDELRNKYNLTVFFYNPNIFPETEYLQRKAEVVRVCTEWQIDMVDLDYTPADWRNAVVGREQDPEGGPRCVLCFALRLGTTARYAAEHGYPIFGTTLTMGSKKSAEIIHPLAIAAAERYGIQFLAEDWKKKGRQDKGRQMVLDRNIYRQNYCGCEYSIKKTLE